MKTLKKLSFLFLSLALLIGVFALSAFAEETNTATVVYPDGSTETVAVGQTITPKAFTDGLYYGAGNTLYKDDATEGWIFTVEGEESALADLTVTEAMVGKTILASGADKVYYSIKISGAYTYHTNADTYANDLRELLRNTPKAQTVTFYSDVSLAATYTYGGSSNTLYIDLNGHKWTITGKASDKTADGKTETYADVALDCSSNLYIYSTMPGGVVDVPTAAAFFRTNDKTIGSQCYGYLRIGEKNLTDKDVNGKNLTVYCKQINPDMYSSNALILGGTYIQRENSTAKYFLLLSREKVPGQSHFTYSTTVTEIRNATFIVTKSGTSPMYWTHKSMTFTNCNFINATDSYAPLFAQTLKMTSSGSIGTPTFSGCSFYNVIPAKRAEYTKSDGSTATYAATYNSSCSFGFSGFAPMDDLDIAETTEMYLIRGAVNKTVEANGTSYTLNATLSTAKGTTVTFRDEHDVFGAEYWAENAEIVKPSTIVEKIDDVNGYNGRNPSITTTKDASGIIANVIWEKALWAFTYASGDEVTCVYVSDCGGTEIGVGDMFYNLFADPDKAYTIKLYSDMTLTKPMGFGPLVKSSNATYNRDYYNSMVNGAITWDLNGKTVTIDASVVGINLTAANYVLATGALNANRPAVFGLEYGQSSTTKILTIKSSRPGAQFINNSAATLFGIGEGKQSTVKIDDASNHITIRSKGKIFESRESTVTTAFDVNGGTYIYEGTSALALFSKTVKLKNATFICTQVTTRVFDIDGYRYNNLSATGCTFYSPSGAYILSKSNGNTSAFASSSSTSKFVFSDCSFVNVAIRESLSVSYKVNSSDAANTTFTVNVSYTNAKVSDAAALALAYKNSNVTDLVVAFSQKTVNGTTYKLIGYYAADEVGLVDWGFGVNEYWKLGETALRGRTVIDGVFGYTFASVTVTAGTNVSTATLAAIKPGALQMNLVLQSRIGLNLLISEALAGATVKIGDADAVILNGELTDGCYRFETAIAPNVADVAIPVVITVGENVHTVNVSVENYAKKILTSEDAEIAKAKNLAYAMAMYVSVMADNADFLSDVAAPAEYAKQALVAKAPENSGALLVSIAFRLDGTIAIAVKGTEDAVGRKVNLVLSNGRSEWATMTSETVIFEGLYVNEFFGDMTLKIEDEIYTYSLANYLNGLTADGDKTAVQALYNYAYHADAYVKILQNVEPVADRTLDAAEQARMREGILALMFSENIDPIKLLKDMYLVAFSESPTLASTPSAVLDGIFSTSEDATPVKMRAIVAPTLYGGSAVNASLDSLFRGARALATKEDLLVGDILFVTVNSQTNAYIYDGSALVSVMNGCSYADTDAVLSSLANAKRYAVLRPSITLATLRYAGPVDNVTLTDAQIALIETAKAYLQRGYRQQYDDTGMASNSEYRWQIGQYAPEDYTSQKWGYLNCAAFTYECYRNALGMDLGNRYTTNALCKYYLNGGKVGVSEYPYYYSNVLNVSESNRTAEQEKFMSTLVPGDLVVILRKGGYGHVMMYIGDGVLVHSSGSSFGYSSDSETYEPTIRYMNVLGYLFNPDSTNYLFREVEDTENGGMRPYIETLAIVRPLDSFNGNIPENTRNRVQNLSGILAEKLSSHPEGKTVNIGESVTFTFRVRNNGFTSKTLEIKDYIPENATLLSAGDFTYADGVLSVNVTVEAGATVEVSYTVTASGALGAVIHGKNATVGGVLHTCRPIYIENTLTEAQQAALLAAVEQFKASNPDGLTNFDLVNAIYSAAGLEAPFAEGEDVRASLFKNVTVGGYTLWQLIEDSEYYDMVAPTLYGGRKYYTPQKYTSTTKVNTDRSRLPREQALVVGDVLVVRFSSSNGMYLYVGNGVFLNIANSAMPKDSYSATVRLMRMMSVGNYYAVLRPSLG